MLYSVIFVGLTFSVVSSKTVPGFKDLYIHPPGVGNYYYKLYTEAKNWADARATCKKDGGDLVVINSEAEEKFLVNLLIENKDNLGQHTGNLKQALIGVHDPTKLNKWATVHGKPLVNQTYVHWAEGEPNNNFYDHSNDEFGNENCVSLTLHSGIGMNDVSCEYKLAYFCESKVLRKDYSFTSGVGSHKLYTDAKNWEDARSACSEDGAHLAIINSEKEEKALRGLLEEKQSIIKGAKKTHQAFIGVYDLTEQKDWVTVLGEPLASIGYVRWANGEPNKNVYSDKVHEGEYCGSLKITGGMNDIPCHSVSAYICARPVEKSKNDSWAIVRS